jgi:hypothetical protein
VATTEAGEMPQQRVSRRTPERVEFRITVVGYRSRVGAFCRVVRSPCRNTSDPWVTMTESTPKPVQEATLADRRGPWGVGAGAK